MKKPMDIENACYIDVIDPLVQEYLETELMQDKFHDSDFYENADKEAAGWFELINNQALIDEEITEAIMEFCQKPEFAGAAGARQLASLEKLPDFDDLAKKNVERNPLPSEVRPPKIELKKLPEGLKYAYLGEEESLPVIINSQLTQEQEAKLLTVLGRNKKAFGWSLADLIGISPDLCMHHIRLEECAKVHRDPQRKLNPNMREEVLKEVLKLLFLGIIYSIPDSEWVSPVHMVPKKSGIQVVVNEKNELVPTMLVTGWRMCIDYRKLNAATRKDHFPFPFIDQMLERLAGKQYFCFLSEYSGYFKFMWIKRTKRKPPLLAHLGHMHIEECRLDCAMHPKRSKDA